MFYTELDIKIIEFDELNSFILIVFKDKINVISSAYDLLVEFNDVL